MKKNLLYNSYSELKRLQPLNAAHILKNHAAFDLFPLVQRVPLCFQRSGALCGGDEDGGGA